MYECNVGIHSNNIRRENQIQERIFTIKKLAHGFLFLYFKSPKNNLKY